MNLEFSNNLDLLKSQIGLAKLAPLEKTTKGLAADTSKGGEADKKRWKAALDFEAMFLGQMYKAMRKSTMGEGGDLTEASPGREMFTEMLDNQYAGMSSKNHLNAGSEGMKNAVSGLSNGLAAQIYRSLARAEGQTATAVTPPPIAKIFGDYARVGKSTAGSALPDEKLKPIIALASKTYDVPANLIKSVIKAESNNQPLAVSSVGAKGLMQLMDSTAKDLRVRNVFNVGENILAGTRYLKQMLVRFGGDEEKALAAYNAGPATVERYKGVPPYNETKAYVEKVLKAKKSFDSQGGLPVVGAGN
ncbi:MAG: transglycosylase SLT domain-containing protein [Fibrobacterota bacterium]|nr:transglycosylase SLT domain-containing protein [Fibrobacterota bacterium]